MEMDMIFFFMYIFIMLDTSIILAGYFLQLIHDCCKLEAFC